MAIAKKRLAEAGDINFARLIQVLMANWGDERSDVLRFIAGLLVKYRARDNGCYLDFRYPGVEEIQGADGKITKIAINFQISGGIAKVETTLRRMIRDGLEWDDVEIEVCRDKDRKLINFGEIRVRVPQVINLLTREDLPIPDFTRPEADADETAPKTGQQFDEETPPTIILRGERQARVKDWNERLLRLKNAGKGTTLAAAAEKMAPGESVIPETILRETRRYRHQTAEREEAGKNGKTGRSARK